ncbi:hypothetical protein DFQ30_008890 [Apophysomyces sp. BC1015]|nr:hypothetical protein DFQ30_008890 [Apophysomyces sp. BC1015]
MLESLVSTLLNRVLGAYVSNLNYNQLQIGIWSGDVVLRNLKLKREALDKLNLPVDVLEGYLGELTLNIPWSNLKGSPVKVNIRDVFVLAVPRNESTMTTEEIETRKHEAKMRKLANAELINHTEYHDAAEDAKNETFVNQLVTKILNNLQFSITNIHVRYEDDISTPGHRFAAGITLSELSAISTDENWVPKTIDEAVNTIHKIATKSNIPSEHQYILKPVSGTGRLKLNKKFGEDIPKVDATLLFDELSFVVDDEQYRDAIRMVDLFHSYLKKQKYQNLHPPSHMTPRSNPSEFFQFAGEAVLSEIRERNRQWTWDHFKERRDDRLKYLECYVAQKLGQETPEQVEQLNILERKLSYEDIRFYRSISKSRLKREKAILEAEEKRRQEAAEKSTGTNGWLSTWWYGTAPPIAESETTDQTIVITEEQKQEFYEAIEYDEDKAAVAASIDFPKNTMFLNLRTTLNKGSFTIRRNPHAENPVELVSLVYDTVMLGAVQYVESLKATAALGDLRLYDGVTKNSQYRQLIGVKQKEDPKRRQSKIDRPIVQLSNIQDPFFSIVFEYKPLDGRADNAIGLVMRNIDIVYNPVIIREILNFFRPPETSVDSINALIEVAGDTLEDIKQQTRSSLEFALEQHTTLDLRVDMDAPVIVIPEDCTSSSSRGIVLDAGHINIESNLAPLEAINRMKAKRTVDYTSEDYIRLRSLMYDKFTVHLTQTKILVGDSVETCLAQVRQPTKEYRHLHLVDRIDLTFLVEMCIIRKSADLARFKISGHLPLVGVNFSDTKYRIIMQIPRLIEESGLLSSSEKDVDDTSKLEQQSNTRNQRRGSFRRSRLWKQAEQSLFFDSSSEQSGTEDEMGSASITQTDPTSTQQSTVSGKSTKDKYSDVNQKIFELSFKVDKVSAIIMKSSNKLNMPHAFSEILLCELALEHLTLNYSQRPYDMFVTLSLTSLRVTDRMKHGNEFQYLVTSDRNILQPLENAADMNSKDLVNIEYIRVAPSSPEYVDKYNEIDQTAKVTLSTLNFIITRSSVLTMYNFILDTFVEEENTFATEWAKKRTSLSSDPRQQRRSSSYIKPSPQKKSSSIHVRLFLDSVNFILNNDGVRLATGELSHGDMSTLLRNGKTQLTAKFANFTLTDDLTSSKEAIGQRKPYSNQLLTIQGEELIDLRFESFINDGGHEYPGYDQSLYLRMGSAQFTFLEQPVSQLLDYLSKFAAMKSIYDRARQAALESAQQYQEANTKTHFDVVIKTPVVQFPETRSNSSDVIVAHLGEIWASNSFIQEDDEWINTIQAGLRAISLTSKFYIKRPESEQLLLQTLPILDDIDLNFDIKCVQEVSATRPDVDIRGVLTNISMRLTERQYIFLMDIVNIISRVFSGTDASENVLSPTDENTEGYISQEGMRKMRENGSQQVLSAQEGTHTQPRKIQLALTSQTIALELYSTDNTSKDTQALVSLACIALNDAGIHCDMFKDDRIRVVLQVRSLTVDDTRPNIKSKFKEIMPAIENGNQFEMELDVSRPEPSRHGIAFMTVNDPKVILSLDHAFMLRDFFMSAFTSTASPQYSSPGSKQGFTNNAADNGMEISYQLNIVNAEFILLANPDSEESEAVVLSAERIMISRQAVTALVVQRMGMFLCRMDVRKTSTLKFIQKFDVSITMNNNTLDRQGSQLTELEIHVDALVLRLSYRDAILITDIFNKAYGLYDASATSQADSPSSGIIHAQKLTASSNQTKNRIDNALSKESLRATFQGVQIILIEEIHEMPMVDMNLKPFRVNVQNWSRLLAAEVSFSTYVNYFNIKNSHWEPLVEPWDFKLALSRKNAQQDEPFQMDLLSGSALNVNITHTFIESSLAVMRLWDEQGEFVYSGERGTIAPYRIKNRTGYRIHLWNADNADSSQAQIRQLDDGEEIMWWFEDWRKRRETTTSRPNLLNVQLEGAMWQSLRSVSVDTEGEHVYPLEPKIQDIQHRVMFEVKLIDNVKLVTIRSAAVIENRTLLPIDVAILDRQGRIESSIKKIAPGDDYAIPIESAYHNRFCVRPDAGFGYKWTENALYWKDLIRPTNKLNTIECRAKAGDMPPFIFQLHTRLDKKGTEFGHYPAMTVRLSAPVEIENLLPHDFNFRIIDRTTTQDFNSFLRKGGTTPIHVIKNGHLLLLSISLLDTDKAYSQTEFSIISANQGGIADFPVEDSITVIDRDNVPLKLKIHRSDIPNSGGASKYTIFCPYVVINKTGHTISFKEKPAWKDAMFSPAPRVSTCRPGAKPEPFMYSYQKLHNGNRSLIQVSGSDWSRPVSFEAIGSAYDVVIPTPSKTEEVHVGISVQEGQAKLTKVITITPRFILSNQMDGSIRYREPGSRVDSELESKQRTPLYYLPRNTERQLSIKLPGINNMWSAPFNIEEIGVVHVRLNSADNVTNDLMRVTIVLQDATIFIIFTKEKSDRWPYLLVNETKEDITFYQEDISILSDDQSSNRGRNTNLRRYLLRSRQSIPYSWDMPALREKKIILNIHGRERSISLQEIGSQLPFRHTTYGGEKVITSIDIKRHGTCQVLKLTPFKLSESYFRPTSTSSSSDLPVTQEGFEAVEIKPVYNLVFQLQLSQIGISVIDRHLQEIVYITFRGVDVTIKDSNLYQSLRWNVHWVQIDNQMYDTIFPILLYPTTMTKESDQEILPTFQLALDRVKDDSHGVLYFKYFSVLLQRISIGMDDGLICRVLDFLKFDIAQRNASHIVRQQWDYSTDVPDVKPQEDMPQLFFEMFHIQPIQLDFSFFRTSQLDIIDERYEGSATLNLFINIMTMALGNIDAASLKFNALAVENVTANGPDLANRIIMHYRDQGISQIYKFLGSADFLGNPGRGGSCFEMPSKLTYLLVGLFLNLGSGVAELLYEPWQGLIMSDRPQDLGMGIARGLNGFVRKSVFGVTDSVARFTGSIGQGLSAATMDREYQNLRRMNLAKNKPLPAWMGVAQGGVNFYASVQSGITGLVKQPLEGAHKEGVNGFLTGVGKGLLGAVTKPVAGAFDFASNVTDAIRSTTTDGTNDIGRIRPPRFIGEDVFLKPYSLREAQGAYWLRKLDHWDLAEDTYIAHCPVQDNERVAMVTSRHIMLIKTRQLSIEWSLQFTKIQTIKCEPTGIAIFMREASLESFLVIPNKTDREQFYKRIEETVMQYNRRRRLT